MVRRRQRSRGTGTLFKRNGHGKWIARWYDHTGKCLERFTCTTHRAAAERILSKRIADAALRRSGVVDARTDRYEATERRTISEHVADWKAALTAKGVTPKHVALLVKRVETLLAAVKTQRMRATCARDERRERRRSDFLAVVEARGVSWISTASERPIPRYWSGAAHR